MNPYNPPKKGEKQSCRKCRWLPVCIDPCLPDCENADVVDSNCELPPGKKYCEFEQGDKECRKIAGKTCETYEPRLPGVDLQLIDCMKKLS